MHFNMDNTTPAKLFSDISMMSKFVMEHHSDNIDPLMLPVCKWFNELPGLATRYCCESHPELAGFPSKPYLMFAYEGDGLTTLIRFMNHLNKLVFQVDGIGDAFSEVEISNATDDDAGWYLCAVLRGPYLGTTEIKANWFTWLNQAMKTFEV